MQIIHIFFPIVRESNNWNKYIWKPPSLPGLLNPLAVSEIIIVKEPHMQPSVPFHTFIERCVYWIIYKCPFLFLYKLDHTIHFSLSLNCSPWTSFYVCPQSSDFLFLMAAHFFNRMYQSVFSREKEPIVCMYTHIRICVSIYFYICLSTYIHREREVYFKKMAHVIMEAWKSKLCRTPSWWRFRSELVLSLEMKFHRAAGETLRQVSMLQSWGKFLLLW